MMSAKTVLTDAPAATTPSTAGGATPTAPGAEATPFQNLLAAASPQVVDLTLDALPAQPLPQFAVPANAKQPGRPVLVTAQPGTQSPADLLQLLDDAALPESGDTVCSTPEDLADEFADNGLDEPSRDDILTDWMEAMVPAGVFAAQAGSDSTGEAPEKRPGGHDAKALAIPTSLATQALVPDDTAAKTATTPSANAPPVPTNIAAVAQNAAAVIAPAHDRTERDSSANDWMTALGDATAKRTHEAPPTAATRIAVPVHDSRWADAIAHRLVMMAREGESVAQLKLVPQELGPLDIQITVKDSEATVHFGAANAETRTVLESSIPRLREMLSAQGLQLNNASVSHQSPNQNKSDRQNGPSAITAATDDPDSTPAKVVSTSLLDIYA